jgi:hypothetical protein
MARTKMHKDRLLQILQAPPADYDGSNACLATYMGLSERSITRILGLLAKDGKIRLTQNHNAATSGLYTKRFIQLKRS